MNIYVCVDMLNIHGGDKAIWIYGVGLDPCHSIPMFTLLRTILDPSLYIQNIQYVEFRMKIWHPCCCCTKHRINMIIRIELLACYTFLLFSKKMKILGSNGWIFWFKTIIW